MPVLKRIVGAIDVLNRSIGRAVMWLAVAMALVQFANVILRYVFAVGFIWLQQSVWYMHGMLFMLGAGFALMVDGHVRVDVVYRDARPRVKAWIDLLGSLFLLLPLCVATFWLSRGYVINSWRILEGSTEMSGIPGIFLLKTVIWLFALLLGLQGIALALRAFIALWEDDPH
jgi:TRAP-type mannitol/chloroaromatic compound transport system permease small subunit